MYSVFMDNYRGFSETIIPLRSATFLVGENSTGKSSLLSLLYLFSTSHFWLDPNFAPSEFCDLGGFKDIVSACGPDTERFTIGLLSAPKTGRNAAKNSNGHSFTLMTFENEEGIPRLVKHMRHSGGRILKVIYRGRTSFYKEIKAKRSFADEAEFLSFFMHIFHEDAFDKKGFKRVPKELATERSFLLLQMLNLVEGSKKDGKFVLQIDPAFPGIQPLLWLAPIRTKSKRIYEGFKTDFTPEGAHTPHIIRKMLRSAKQGRRFTELLERFGDSSGLFKTVNAHSFGRDPAAPFEVVVQLKDQPLNISNVGYGVSQVLPLIVEMLSRPKGFWFAIQQPEVHLHPRAQAALGELIHFMVQENGHRYVVETHSDYLIDRFRLGIKESGKASDAQVVFFERISGANKASPMLINAKGQYPREQPKAFREFFIREEMRLLEI